MNKLTNVESQRVMAVLGDMLDRLNYLTYVPLKRDYHLIGRLHENGVSAVGDQVEQLWQLDDGYENMDANAARREDVLGKIKLTVRSICRHMRENPRTPATPADPGDEMMTLIKFLSELTDLMFSQLSKTVEDETSKRDLMENMYNRRKQAEDDLVQLRDKLSDMRKTKEDDISHLDIQLQKLKGELATINKVATANELLLIQTQVKETLEKAYDQHSIEMQALLETYAQHEQLLQKNTMDHREVEDALRKAKCKIAVEVASTIEKYDQDMLAVTTEIDGLQERYTAELNEFQALSEHFVKIDEEQARIEEEERILEAIREEERREIQKLHNAAVRIQSMWRGSVVRREYAAKKKKGGKKGKKK
ncbi:hypothetical protein DYB26_011564 [Aphanomyces astaci]|uniref:Dynein regulatory complex protein 10 n=1 Tax=Aphanomyces astaci TaxID=112090 RepID=A0A397D5F9_APHAT|nr:hypothetical protein DYB38_005660 [Aphanomyces astaci]RHZ38904.1 hypothetical protein DYB26_011564 [Aphanomyces astaci]